MERQEAAEDKGKKSFWVSDMEAVLAIFIVLLVFGSINVFSSSFILAETTFGTPYFFLQRQLFNLAAGFFCFFLALLHPILFLQLSHISSPPRLCSLLCTIGGVACTIEKPVL